MKQTEQAECKQLSSYIEALLPALERFSRFEGPDLPGPQRANWSALLDTPLLQHGQGLESVLKDLQAVLVARFQTGSD